MEFLNEILEIEEKRAKEGGEGFLRIISICNAIYVVSSNFLLHADLNKIEEGIYRYKNKKIEKINIEDDAIEIEIELILKLEEEYLKKYLLLKTQKVEDIDKTIQEVNRNRHLKFNEDLIRKAYKFIKENFNNEIDYAVEDDLFLHNKKAFVVISPG